MGLQIEINAMRTQIAATIVYVGLLVSVVSAQTSPADGIAELNELLKETRDALDHPEFLEGAMGQATRCAALWDVFEWRFGAPAEEVKGWDSFVESARETLRKAAPKAETGKYYNVVPARLVSAICFQVLGRDEVAEKIFSTTPPGGHSGNWYDTVNLAIAVRRSGTLVHGQKYEEALAQHELAIGKLTGALHSKNEDLLFARYGWLLEKNERPEEAHRQWQRVVDLYPGTVGAELSRRALMKASVLVEPSIERLEVYLSSDDRRQAIRAIANHKLSESFVTLQVLLKEAEQAERSSDWELRDLVCAMGMLGDKMAIPDLVRVSSKGPDWVRASALLALLELDHGDQVVPVLEWLADNAGLSSMDSLDAALRKAHGNRGPELDLREFMMRPREVAKAWLKWLESNQDPSPDKR